MTHLAVVPVKGVPEETLHEVESEEVRKASVIALHDAEAAQAPVQSRAAFSFKDLKRRIGNKNPNTQLSALNVRLPQMRDKIPRSC